MKDTNKKIKVLGVVVLLVLLGLIFGTDWFASKTVEGAWYTNGGTWTNRKRIVINSKKVINSNGTAVAGSTSTGAVDGTSVANRMYLVPITVSNTGTITDLQVRTDSTASFNNPRFKGIITDASFNILTNGTTGIVTVLGTDAQSWYTATFATPPSVTSGTTYYVGFVAEDANLYYRTIATVGAYYHDNSFASPTNPTSPTSGTDYVSVYANVAYVQTITNFPMLFSVTDADLKFTGSGGKVASSTGLDILFTSADGTTKLDYEMESYSSTTGQVVAWVEIPSLSTTVDTNIYIYFGNASASDQSNRTGVWDSNYKGVWHLDETASDEGTVSNLYLDSTSNANSGTQAGPVSTSSAQIVKSQDFDGTNDTINVGDTASLDINTSAITLSAWVYDDATTNMDGYIMGKVSGTWNYSLSQSQGNQSIDFAINTSSGLITCQKPGGAGGLDYLHNKWNYITGVYDGSALRIYIDGSQSGTTCSQTGTIIANNDGFAIGDRGVGSANNYFDGLIDEVRVSNTARSAGWIKTQYNNQSDPATFYAYEGSEYQNRIGPAEKVRGGGTVNLTNPAVKVRGGVKFR